MRKLLLILVLIGILLVSGCVEQTNKLSSEKENKGVIKGEIQKDVQLSCPDSCDDEDRCTMDYCFEYTNFQCRHDDIIPCCGNNVCEEDIISCFDDCKDNGGDYNYISENNVVVIYNKKFSEEVAKDYLQDTLICIPYLKDKLKIDLPEPLKTRFMFILKLIDIEHPFSFATSTGITNLANMKSYENRLKKDDYFKEKIKEGVCLNLHEMTHVFVSMTPIPQWANEGLATYSELEFQENILEIECRERGWYGLDFYGEYKEHPYSNLSMPRKQYGEPGIHWYYTGYCFWGYIKEKYGEDTVIKIVQELKENENNYSADFFKDIVNKVLNEDITKITKERFGVPMKE